MQVDVPPQDVHGGYALKLDWLHGGATDAVKFNGGPGTTIYTPRTNITVDPNNAAKWLVSSLLISRLMRLGLLAQLVSLAGCPAGSQGTLAGPGGPAPSSQQHLSCLCTNAGVF